jgi:CheY-like chemotaxis protein
MPKEFSCELHEADNAETALSIALEVNPDITFLDYNLPGKNGADIARDLLQAGVETKFVLLTANLQPSVIKEVEDLGFTAILDKPITTAKLSSVLEQTQ